MIKKLFTLLYKNFLILFFLLICLEIISFISLLSLVYISKVTNLQRYDVLLFRSDLPHPLIRTIFNKSENQEINFVPGKSLAHPNYGWYKSVDQFGNDRTWLNKGIDDTKLTLVMLGGSTVEGDGANVVEETIAYQLEKNLNENRNSQCKKIQVLNEGLSGWYSKQEFLHYVITVLPITKNKIEAVISLNGVNDVIGFFSHRNNKQHANFYKSFSTRELNLSNALFDLAYNGKSEFKADKISNFLHYTFSGKFLISLFKIN
jgi:hypothetical protein